MPQMAPLSWYPLMMSFITCLLLFSVLTFWILPTPSPKHEYETQAKKINWKW
uniref:ATP synthase complex subunit 8 n=1 Tax=Mecistocephalus marmoratus TaxID=980230 RepID=A0A4Y1K814_9MYRI|nr:ATP synthase F0 subunit 8 [Mecistocephalus marmoratus]ARU77307.1 ATP synthase F0 subunit 8 [Mecistocephalus marmoratus]